MYPVTILAQTNQTWGETAQTTQETAPVHGIWEQVMSLNLVEAVTLISFGVICVFYGWRVFKILVIISFAMLGLVGGIAIGNELGDYKLLGGLLGFGLLAGLSLPLMRWAVCILGAVAGGIITGGVWYACGLPEKYILAGALVGIVAGGMISFIVFRIAVMLFTCLGGSALMVIGVLSLLYSYSLTREEVENLVVHQKWFVPVLLLVPTVLGVILQNKLVKNSHKWEL